MMEEKALRKNGNCFCGSSYEPEEGATVARMEDTVFIECHVMLGCKEGHEKEISCGQCGILEAVTPECGWVLVGNCDRAL